LDAFGLERAPECFRVALETGEPDRPILGGIGRHQAAYLDIHVHATSLIGPVLRVDLRCSRSRIHINRPWQIYGLL
jgi:hypothetical protein